MTTVKWDFWGKEYLVGKFLHTLLCSVGLNEESVICGYLLEANLTFGVINSLSIKEFELQDQLFMIRECFFVQT